MRQLGAVLAKSPQCQECVVKQYFRYTAGRMETPADQPADSKPSDVKQEEKKADDKPADAPAADAPVAPSADASVADKPADDAAKS
jgi:hypothetical protein